MENTLNGIMLVPHDFSSASSRALEFSADLAGRMKRKLGILNIHDTGTLAYVKNKGIALSDLDKELADIAAALSSKYMVETECFIKPSGIKMLGETAFGLKAGFISIGLEKQRAGASKIMRMISKSKVPVFIVYDKPYQPIKDIVFPLDNTEESRQKTGWAAQVALATGATIHIFSVNVDNDAELDRMTHDLIVKQIEKYFAQKWINFKTVHAKKEKSCFGQQYVTYAESINAGLIVIMRESTSFLSSVIWKANDKAVFFNPTHIPSLIVNPKVINAR